MVDETWYKELEDPDTFYTNITALKLIDHLTEFCLEFHNVSSMEIPQLMKTLFTDAEEMMKFINAMEAAQQNPKLAKL